METTFPIIVNTCDSYEDVWPFFFYGLQEYWPQCSNQIIFNTEYKKSCAYRKEVQIHNSKIPSNLPDKWGKRFRDTLMDIDSEFVMVVYDDFVLNGPVADEKILECLQWLKNNPDISVFYFAFPPHQYIEDSIFHGFVKLSQRSDYKLNSAPALWRKEHLINFIHDDDNPWAWEYFGSYRTYSSPLRFYCQQNSSSLYFPYDSSRGGAVYRGKWVTSVITPLIEKFNIQINLEARGTFLDTTPPKRSIKWILNFFKTGYDMIGFAVFIYLKRILVTKIGSLL